MSDFAGAEERDKEIAMSKFPKYIQWPFQEPKLEVPTIYKAYVREYPLYGTVPPF